MTIPPAEHRGPARGKRMLRLRPSTAAPRSLAVIGLVCLVAGALPILAVPASCPNGTDGCARHPDGVVSPYDAGALGPFDAPTSENWPAWRRGKQAWTWIRIPGSDLSRVEPRVTVPGNLKNRINAWNGLAANRNKNRLYSVGNGGHADYAGNEAYVIDLSRDSPEWKILSEPTPKEDIKPSNASKGIFHDYYLDGRPSSTHTYYALNFLATRNAVFKFGAGSLWGTGNEANWKTDAFSLESNDWQAAGTWPDVVPDSRKSVIAASTCLDPSTEEVYVAAPTLRRFDPRSGSFEVLSRWPMNSSAVYARACAVDTKRRRIVYFGDAYSVPQGGMYYDIGQKRFAKITFSGNGVEAITKKDHNFAWYEPQLDKFLLKTRARGDVYSIDPETFTVTKVTTIGGDALPDAYAGVQSRWQRLPRLAGYAYYPRHGADVWFLPIR